MGVCCESWSNPCRVHLERELAGNWRSVRKNHFVRLAQSSVWVEYESH